MVEKSWIEGIVGKSNRYLELGKPEYKKPEKLEEDKKIAQHWIFGISHLGFNVNDYLNLNTSKKITIPNKNKINDEHDQYAGIIIPSIYRQLEKELESASMNLQKAQNQSSTYEVLKGDSDFPQSLLPKAPKNQENSVYSSIKDLADITAYSVNQATGMPVKIGDYGIFFPKSKEPIKTSNPWGKSAR